MRASAWVPARRIVIVTVVAALYAAAAILSDLDRISADGPPRAPRAFAVEAARSRALAALERGDGATARIMARDAVARDPIDARSVGLLAQALLTGGALAEARRAFTVARPLGWREPFTQLYWINARLAAGDPAGAADHVDAILRQAPALAQRNLLLAPFDATAAGRFQLAARLVRRPAWAANYFNDTRDPLAGDPMARGETAVLVATRFHLRDCALVAPLIEALVGHSHPDEAQRLYALNCASAGEAAAPVDGGFERAALQARATVFDWRFVGQSTIGIGVQPAAGMRGRAAVVSNTAARTAVFATQLLALAPGRYRLTWRALGSDGRPSAAVAAAVGCNDGIGDWLPEREIDPRAGRFAADFPVPPDCIRPTLALGIASGADAIAVDDVRLDRAP